MGDSCGICGRTILNGERTRRYLSPSGEPQVVCELCRGRAARLDWVLEELAAEQPPPPRSRRRPRLVSLRRRRRGAPLAAAAEPALEVSAPEGEPGEPAITIRRDPDPDPEPERRPDPDPAAPGASVGRSEPPAVSAEEQMMKAMTRFNASMQAQTVAGLMRSLGPPWVTVGSGAGSAGEIRITVAWELCWYQWGVDLGDELRPVYEIDRGHEVDQLDSPARHWNATADVEGQLRLGAPVGN